jgi:carboxylesterase type B
LTTRTLSTVSASAVCHGDELPYVFHTAHGRGFDFTSEESELSNLMIDYWTNFAKELNPEADNIKWPPFGQDSISLVFETPVDHIKTESDPEANCALWNETGYDLHDSFWGIF